MYDAIIVGAGPGGSSAAIYSNKLGLNCLLLDKSVFPRDKVCGDALSGKSVKLLDELGFIDDINKLEFNKNTKFYFICSSGIRSQIVAEIFKKKKLETFNITDGFNGWLLNNLPIK
mgnify:CR=1 FL=1